MTSTDSVTTSMHTPYYNNNKPEESSSLSQDYNYYYKAQIEEAYTAIYGRKMPPVIRSQIRSLMAQGAMPDLIAAVIEYSAAAPRPSWAYARTVLERQLESLAAHHYEGDLVLGLWGAGYFKDPDAALRRSVQWVRESSLISM